MHSSYRVQTAAGLMPFDADKLYLSVLESLPSIDQPTIHARDLTNTILGNIMDGHSLILELDDIRTAVLSVLKRYDRRAYVTYAAKHS